MEEVEDREDNLYLERIFQSSPESSGGPGYVNRRMTMSFDATMAKINEIIRLFLMHRQTLAPDFERLRGLLGGSTGVPEI